MDQTLSGVYVHKVVGDAVTIYWDGKNATATSLPVGTTQTPTRLGNNTPNSVAKFVYYIRNLRIWHRELTENQINGLR